MGTASRIVEGAFGRYTLGVLVQGNFGLRRQLRIAGVQVGKELAALIKPMQWLFDALGGPPDVVIECAGQPGLIAAAVDLVAFGGVLSRRA